MQSLSSDELETSHTEAVESSSQPRTTSPTLYFLTQDYHASKLADPLREFPSDLASFRSNDTRSDVYEGKRSDDDLSSYSNNTRSDVYEGKYEDKLERSDDDLSSSYSNNSRSDEGEYEGKHSDDDLSSSYSNNTRSDVDEGKYEWPTVVIPKRKMYTIAGEDRDYGTEEDLPEVYIPNPFDPGHSSSEYDSEGDTMPERPSSSSPEEIDYQDDPMPEHPSSSSSEEIESIDPHAGEINSEGDPDDLLRRILEVLSEHMIDRSEASTPELCQSLKVAPGERI
ncbi:hypothetical protein C0993_008828 [Termitomyces sp. T159_Od127]|nr:hypothetical protein C0993_008828 [Termitomyces sp. T159_Od127]